MRESAFSGTPSLSQVCSRPEHTETRRGRAATVCVPWVCHRDGHFKLCWVSLNIAVELALEKLNTTATGVSCLVKGKGLLSPPVTR